MKGVYLSSKKMYGTREGYELGKFKVCCLEQS